MFINERDHICYHGFLQRLRKKNRASQGQVCKGICTASAMNRFEKGNRMMEKLMRDRFTARLGISCEKYEDYLQPKEYVRWEQRLRIVKAIEKRELEQAKEELDAYALSAENNCINLQFVDTMRYMIFRLEDAPREILLDVLKNAVKHTVPNVKKALAGEHLLCDQEINLIAEVIRLEEPKAVRKDVNAWRIAEYEKMIAYIEGSGWENIQKAKIYPKIVYHICQSLQEKEATQTELCRGLELCHAAIELLEDMECLYYMNELTEARRRLTARLMGSAIDSQEERTLEEKTDFCYLYHENECYHMAKVIETRRQMLGISRKKLAEGICSVRTVVRLEREGINPSIDMVRHMFEKMGLCAEYRRARVVTKDVEVLLLSDEVIQNKKHEDFEKWEENLKKLEECLCMAIPQNKQEVCVLFTTLMYRRGDIGKEEFCRRLKLALEYTLPITAINVEGEKHLTKSERTIIGLLEAEKN